MKFKWAFAVLCERIYNNTKRYRYSYIDRQIDTHNTLAHSSNERSGEKNKTEEKNLVTNNNEHKYTQYNAKSQGSSISVNGNNKIK